MKNGRPATRGKCGGVRRHDVQDREGVLNGWAAGAFVSGVGRVG